MSEVPRDLKSTVRALEELFGKGRAFETGRGYEVLLMDIALGARGGVLSNLGDELQRATELCEERDAELSEIREQLESKELELARAIGRKYAITLALEAAEQALPSND